MTDLFADVRRVIETVAWATVASVDPEGRPYTRLLHPVWEFDASSRPLRAWIGTSPTPLKKRHLERSPYLSLGYWSPAHDTANVECQAGWVAEPEVRRRVWALIGSTPPPMGYDPAPIWPGGPDSPEFGLLRLVPYRVRVRTLDDLVAKRPVRLWRNPEPGPPAEAHLAGEVGFEPTVF